MINGIAVREIGDVLDVVVEEKAIRAAVSEIKRFLFAILRKWGDDGERPGMRTNDAHR